MSVISSRGGDRGLPDRALWPSGIEGAGGGFSVITTTLNDEQIKALPTTTVVIIPPTSTPNYSGMVSTIFAIVKAFAILDARAGAYVGLDSTSSGLYLYYGSTTNHDITVGVSDYVVQANGSTQRQSLSVLNNLAALAYIEFLAGSQLPFTDQLYDNALIMDMGANANLTGGNPANTLKVTVLYITVTL